MPQKRNANSPPEFQTHGEKMYDLVFNQGINFWANLIISAGFTYWVNHSKAPIMKNPPSFMKWAHERPIEIHSDVRNWIHSWLPLSGAKMAEEDIKLLDSVQNGIEPNKRMKVAKFMADALTLTSAGTVVMIPGVWAAQKFKGDFVRWQDRMHYGADVNSAWVQERHDHLDQEKKPTLLGYTVGRLGSMAAVQATAFTVGDGRLVKWVGHNTPLKFLEKFEGIDHVAGSLGDALGGSVASISRTMNKGTNEFMRDHAMDWSLDQRRWAFKVKDNVEQFKPAKGITNEEWAKESKEMLERAHKILPNNAPEGVTQYDRAFQDFGKYIGLDTLYTAVTAGTIVPLVGWLKENVPGMSYTTPAKQRPSYDERPVTRVSRNTISRDATLDTPELKAAR